MYLLPSRLNDQVIGPALDPGDGWQRPPAGTRPLAQGNHGARLINQQQGRPVGEIRDHDISCPARAQRVSRVHYLAHGDQVETDVKAFGPPALKGDVQRFSLLAWNAHSVPRVQFLTALAATKRPVR